MAHEIDMSLEGGRAMYAREPAWHRLGTVKDDNFSATEILTQIGYDVDSCPLTATAPDGTKVSIGSHVANLRQVDGVWQDVGVIGASTSVIQIREQLELWDTVVGQLDGAHYSAAFALRNGKQFIVVIEVDKSGAVKLDPKGRADTFNKCLVGVNSFNSSLSFGGYANPYRVDCANMLACSMGSGPQVTEIERGRWFTRHTKNVMDRVAEAKRTLGIWTSYMELFEQKAEDMIEATLSDNVFQACIEDVFTNADANELRDKDREAMSSVRALYEVNPRNANIHGTVWGGLNATTEYLDWHTTMRKSEKSTEEERRFTRQLRMQVSGNDLKQKAWDRFTALV